MISLIFKGQENLLVLFSAFVIGGIFKTRGLFIPLFTALVDRIRSKRWALMAVSVVTGVLPVEGRVAASAPILDSLVKAPKDQDACCAAHNRGKMGVLDFISNHHYYLWSPLEATVVVVMAGLGLSYAKLLSYTALPLAMYLAYLSYVVFNYIDDSEIELATIRRPYTPLALLNIVPFILGIVVSVFSDPIWVFPWVALAYMLMNRVSVKEAVSFINWKTIGFVACVIILANVVKANTAAIEQFFHATSIIGHSSVVALTLSLAAAGVVSFMLGSSGKYAGVVVALSLVFGIQYLPIILMVEYAGYLLSPSHKCLAISGGYFGTKPSEFYKWVGGLAALMIGTGLFELLLTAH